MSILSSFIRGGEFVALKPNVSFVVGFMKWKGFHPIRHRKDSVLSIKHFKYSLGHAIGILLVEYPKLTGSISFFFYIIMMLCTQVNMM